MLGEIDLDEEDASGSEGVERLPGSCAIGGAAWFAWDGSIEDVALTAPPDTFLECELMLVEGRLTSARLSYCESGDRPADRDDPAVPGRCWFRLNTSSFLFSVARSVTRATRGCEKLTEPCTADGVLPAGCIWVMGGCGQ